MGSNLTKGQSQSLEKFCENLVPGLHPDASTHVSVDRQDLLQHFWPLPADIIKKQLF